MRRRKNGAVLSLPGENGNSAACTGFPAFISIFGNQNDRLEGLFHLQPKARAGWGAPGAPQPALAQTAMRSHAAALVVAPAPASSAIEPFLRKPPQFPAARSTAPR